MTTPDLDTLSLANPWAHDLDSEAIEWREQNDRARLALDAAATAAARELAAAALELRPGRPAAAR